MCHWFRYWWLKVATLPVQLVFMASNGILQGYGYVTVATVVSIAKAVGESGGGAVAILGTSTADDPNPVRCEAAPTFAPCVHLLQQLM